MYLQNTRLRVGMDPRKGGSLTYLSSAVMPPEWSGVNLVNTWDSGRLIQQSYYGCEDGSCWSDKPWNWNPGKTASKTHTCTLAVKVPSARGLLIA